MRPPREPRPRPRPTLFPRVQRDFARLRSIQGRGFWITLAEALLLDAGFQALLAHRLAHAAWRRGIPLLPALCRRWTIAACGADILPRADIGGGCILPHTPGLVIGGFSVVGEDCTILHGVTLGEASFDTLDYPRLGDRVTVGAGATLLGGITVGDDAVIAAGAVVLSDVPPGATVAGIPARVVRAAAGKDEP